MPFSLYYLDRASGYAGSAGQSFQSNVNPITPPADKTNAGVTLYKCDAWTVSGEPVPETTYHEGDAFALTVDFVQGTYAEWIKRVGSGLLVISPWLSPEGFDVYDTASTVVAAASGSSASLKVHAPYNGTISYDATVWFRDYVKPAAPANSNGYVVRFQAIVLTGGAGGTDACSFRLSYVPDIGPFNPTLAQEFPLTMARRNYSTDASLYLWEWHAASDYSDAAVSTSDHYDGITSFPAETHDLYLRGRRFATDAWTNIGLVRFIDPRSGA